MPVHYNEEESTVSKHVKLSDVQLNSFRKLANWKANSDGSIPCPPKEHGGCSSSFLTLKRIFKMNWVAKLVKNVEEMVNGCTICNSGSPGKTGFDLRVCQAASRENGNENFLYNPSSQDVKNEGIEVFRMHWGRGRPVIIKEICDDSAMTIWDPMAIWRGIKEITNEKMKDRNRLVKAVDCSDWSEVYQFLLLHNYDYNLSQFAPNTTMVSFTLICTCAHSYCLSIFRLILHLKSL